MTKGRDQRTRLRPRPRSESAADPRPPPRSELRAQRPDPVPAPFQKGMLWRQPAYWAGNPSPRLGQRAGAFVSGSGFAVRRRGPRPAGAAGRLWRPSAARRDGAAKRRMVVTAQSAAAGCVGTQNSLQRYGRRRRRPGSRGKRGRRWRAGSAPDLPNHAGACAADWPPSLRRR